ncbi:hypothetical protein J2S00_001013 [Caldalkalibacillus uzonensis]|uniref:Uncharacterized protein n=1 Tax=Caldalkalibacillus uzonensis TaxID=353224 RepID=A0ABU0CP85_9BACI|nr:hypothetical protein [Caldalkalibacillus uzonensis]MDQ0338229.1 hypothetical protein [Caldalkalibacillus uzonensis]
MAESKQFFEEKEKIDALLNQGYSIVNIEENLSGAFVDFELQRTPRGNEERRKRLHILTADARKYFSTIVFQQQKAN